MYIKNNAILKAGKTRPTIGTKIAGKKAAVIIYYLLLKFLVWLLITRISQ